MLRDRNLKTINKSKNALRIQVSISPEIISQVSPMMQDKKEGSSTRVQLVVPFR